MTKLNLKWILPITLSLALVACAEEEKPKTPTPSVECSDSKPCVDGKVCTDGVCVVDDTPAEPECSDSKPCTDGKVCTDGVCVVDDSTDDDKPSDGSKPVLGSSCNIDSYVDSCHDNIAYYCESGKVAEWPCEGTGTCAIFKDYYEEGVPGADCAVPCAAGAKVGDTTSTCMNESDEEYGDYSVTYEILCQELTDGSVSGLLSGNYNECTGSCSSDKTICEGDIPCDSNTYVQKCTDTGVSMCNIGAIYEYACENACVTLTDVEGMTDGILAECSEYLDSCDTVGTKTNVCIDTWTVSYTATAVCFAASDNKNYSYPMEIGDYCDDYCNDALTACE